MANNAMGADMYSAVEKQKKHEYYLSHREKIKARSAEYRKANPEKVSAAKKLCYINKRSEYLEKSRAYVREYREQHNAHGRAWRLANPEKNAERCREWKQNNHDKVMESWRKRRAIQLNVSGGHFTDAEFKQLCEETGNKCLCCGATGVKLTADHVIPLNVQAPHSDEITNIQPLCSSCNSKKHTKTIDYRPAMEFSSTL